METQPTPIQSAKTPQNPILTAIAVSLVVGGLAGGAVGWGIVQNDRTTVNGTSVKTVQVQEESATVDVVEEASKAVVSIVISKDFSKVYSNQTSPFDNFFFGLPAQQVPQGKQEIGGGSGFIVESDGLIVTNKHVVNDDQAEYTVVMNDGKKYDAKVVAIDPTSDVAVLKIDATGLPTLTLGDSDKVKIGQNVIAIGNALGQYRNTVTKGVVSGKSRTITASDSAGQSETLEDVFQTDAAINPGNSGGPLLDLDGGVIAVNTAVNQEGQLIGFAIPANVIKKDLESVKKNGSIVRPYLGVRYVVVTKALAERNKLPVEYGALVSRGETADDLAVISGSPADKAGIVENDIILEINGTKIDADHSLVGLLSKYNAGDMVTLKVYHKGETKDVDVKLEERK